MIYITGDTHGSDGVKTRLNSHNFPEQKEMAKNDYVIILGDWGVHWKNNYPNGKICLEDKSAVPGQAGEVAEERNTLDWLEGKNFTTLFIDGNHECFPRLNSYPIINFCNGAAHQIRPSIYHLMRGETFYINGKWFFAFGGASSHDIQDGIIDPTNYKDRSSLNQAINRWNKERKMFRVKNLSWWEEEMPTKEEMENGIKNLEVLNNKVDYIISHTAPASIIAILGSGLYKVDDCEKYLEDIKVNAEYKNWFFGHMHDNRRINDKDYLLYEQIVRIV